MQIIDVHAHIYKYIAGITQGMPLSSFCYGKAKLAAYYRDAPDDISLETLDLSRIPWLNNQQ